VMRFGCQTYSWQMSIEKYRGRIDHISSVVAAAGFAGLEAEMVMLGGFEDHRRLDTALGSTGLQLAALTLVLDWRGEHESPTERESADAAIALTGSFEDTMLVLCQMPGEDRSDLSGRQQRALSCIAEVARRAADAGIRTAFHPNSPEGSVFRTSNDYEILLAGLPDAVGFAADLGHIARGGMDPLSVVGLYRERVNHVHAKDMDGKGDWVPIGTGTVPVAEVAKWLQGRGYDGWFILEDESEMAERDPDAVTALLGGYVDKFLRPIADAVQ
jgi:inosose dehydratase